MAILQDVSSLQAQLNALRAENEKLKAKAAARAPSLSVRVNALGTTRTDSNGAVHVCKGNIGVYGLGRFPVTLYKAQWLKLLDIADDIREAIDNAKPGELADKTSD
jgi:hypothetical protein